jgi:hypothetical protein
MLFACLSLGVACLGVDKTGLVPFVASIERPRYRDYFHRRLYHVMREHRHLQAVKVGSKKQELSRGAGQPRGRPTKRSGEGSPTDGLTSSRKIVRIRLALPRKTTAPLKAGARVRVPYANTKLIHNTWTYGDGTEL